MRRMSEPSDLNPYAPPKADTEGVRVSSKQRRRASGDVQEALARLDEHLSDSGNVQRDVAAAGARVRTITIVMAVLGTAAIGGIVATGTGGSRVDPLQMVSIIVAIFCGVFAIVLLVLDLSLVPHGQPSTPEAALKSFLKALAMGRNGYAWARLCPTAREQTVRTPVLGEITTNPVEVTLSNEAAIKTYTGSFARAGDGSMRTMQVKRVTVVDVQDDVAVIEAELAFQSWPRWVSMILAVSFAVFRLLAIVGLVLFFVLRKKHDTRVRKTMLRGRDGAWYVYDGDILEGAEG
ncbi:hypothetical protein A7982_12277 [Minicystis rosea]|nr:hypothetical protein A7982_12277 [Minicystis rosea]